MKTTQIVCCCALVSSALSAVTPVQADSTCRHVGEVSGTIETLNINPVSQLGTVKLSIRVKGRNYFDGQGIVSGQITEHNPETGEALLDHVMHFGNGTRLDTFNDYARGVPTGKMENGNYCEFWVDESITDAVGTRKLRRISDGQTNIKAMGVVSKCSDNPYNTFNLSGTICLQ